MPDEPTAPVPAPDDRAGETAATPGGAADHRADQVTRVVDVDAEADDVWRAVVDPAERSLWLDDPEARARQVRVVESAPGHRLVWTWWQPGHEGDASTVSVVLTPGDGGGTRVVVTETLPAASPLGGTLHGESVQLDPASRAGAAARRSPSWVHCARDRWDSRLLGLELLFVAARAAVS